LTGRDGHSQRLMLRWTIAIIFLSDVFTGMLLCFQL
jgi:hypothetical protein